MTARVLSMCRAIRTGNVSTPCRIWKAFADSKIQLVFPDLELHFNETASDHLPATGNGTASATSLTAGSARRDPELDWQITEPTWLVTQDELPLTSLELADRRS